MSRHRDRQAIAWEFGATTSSTSAAARAWPPFVICSLPLSQAAEAYRAMDVRRSIKTLLRPDAATTSA